MDATRHKHNWLMPMPVQPDIGSISGVRRWPGRARVVPDGKRKQNTMGT